MKQTLGKRRKARRALTRVDHKKIKASNLILKEFYLEALYQFKAMKRPKRLNMSTFDDLLKFHYADGILNSYDK